ncbi:hypothetical protein [Klebsiella phage phiKp_22]|uniref:Uncharacterized protein n=2 Tax=Viruses TaxID=10239 RepID=A0A159B818_9CAUD|nr:hypothetical protein BI014_gp179 [Klebsiella phage PKO111]AKJ73257.1 hypothetical protein PKO111_179 [Klebsiella phage PKO111]BEH88663.1 hypothetical protein [Klebsiella phage phiKp_22]
MNFTNFNRKYVQNNAWDVSTTLLWEHNNGTVAQIDMYWEDNYVFFSFENGPTLDIQFNGSEIKVGFHDEVRKRDLSTHPSWNTNRQLLVKIYLRHILGRKTTEEQREAIWDIVSNEIKF